MPFQADTTPSSGFKADSNIQGPQDESDLQRQYEHNSVLQKVVGGIGSGGVGEITAPLGQLASAGIGKLASFFKPAAQRSGILSLVKNEAQLGPKVADEVNQAREQFTKSQISPRMSEQYARADEQSIPFNPDEFKGIHPSIDTAVDNLTSTGAKEIPMTDALKLRAQLNDKSLFKDLGPYSEQVAAKQSSALNAGNKLRDTISSVDPNMGAISDELKDAYSLRNAVTNSAGKRPISAVTAGLGTDKGSLLSQFDEQAGTDLRGLGNNIDLAKERLGGASSSLPMSKLGVIKQIRGVIPRGYDALAEMVQPGLQKASSALATPTGQLGSLGALQYMLQRKEQK